MIDWLYISGGAALVLVVGFAGGLFVSRFRGKGASGQPPRIRRNRLVWQIFQWLVISLGVAVAALIAASTLFIFLGEDASQFIQGIVLTALAGAISSILSFVGLIVKGLLDELRGEDGNSREALSPGEE